MPSAFRMLYTPGVQDMKGFLFFAVMMGSLAMAETYTWNPQGNSTKWETASNWQLSDGSQATSLPKQYTNTNEDTYIIGNGATVDATGYSVGNLGATLKIGDNVTLNANYDFAFKNVTIGSNFSSMPGDGIKWATGSNKSTVVNNLTLNSQYLAGTPTAPSSSILTSIGTGSIVNFCTNGFIQLGSEANLQGRALTLSASITLTTSADSDAHLKMVTRKLIGGHNIYYRDVTTADKAVDYTLSSVFETSGLTLTKYDLATSKDAVWIRNGVVVSADDLSAGDYRFVATESDGIGIQYWDNNVPEPTTATLSLLALAGLAARRRRRIA